MHRTTGKVYKIGINPCVTVPESVVQSLLQKSGKKSGPIPVIGTLNREPFKQTIVKYKDKWVLYLNTEMRETSQVTVGDTITVELIYDPKPRHVPMPRKLAQALGKNRKAKAAFDRLPPSRRKEILKYLNFLKSDEALTRNIKKVIEKELSKQQ